MVDPLSFIFHNIGRISEITISFRLQQVYIFFYTFTFSMFGYVSHDTRISIQLLSTFSGITIYWKALKSCTEYESCTERSQHSKWIIIGSFSALIFSLSLLLYAIPANWGPYLIWKTKTRICVWMKKWCLFRHFFIEI